MSEMSTVNATGFGWLLVAFNPGQSSAFDNGQI
jgi:hypothetical protein